MSRFLVWQNEHRRLNFSHTRTLYCIGVSAGAYAALTSGYFLRAAIVWAFAPPITQTKTASSDVRLTDVPSDEFSQRCTDLAELLKQGNETTEYRIFYNEAFDRDRLAAERLQGCPGVRLFPQGGLDHRVVTTMHKLGSLEDLFVPFEPA